jgi:hypothetical protein
VKGEKKILTQERHRFFWSNNPRRTASLNRTFLCVRPYLLLKGPEFREQTCCCVADGFAQIAQPHRGVEPAVVVGLAFLGSGVEVSLCGRRGFTARGLYSARPRGLARKASCERISSSLRPSRLPRLGGLVQNDSAYGQNKCYVE